MGSWRESVKKIRDEISRWCSRHPRITSFLIYSILCVVVCFLGYLIFSTSGLSETNIDNARYMLSALVQGQAAIISIVITLTLVAVQLSASAYSPRVIDIMKKNPDMWILLSVYAVLICYGLMVLKSLEVTYIQVAVGEGTVYYGTLENSPAVFGRSFEELVYYAYILGAFSVFALIPYMINTISLLKPENIIKKLVNEIDESNILDGNGSGFQPVFDVIHVAIAKYDLTTTRDGLDAVEGRVEDIMDKTDASQSDEISKIFCSYLKRCAFAAANNDDEEVVGVLVNKTKNFGNFVAGEGLEDATLRVADALKNVGEKAADQGLKDATLRVACVLGTVGVKAADQGLEEATEQVAYELGTVGVKAADQGFEGATLRVADALENVGVKAADQGFEGAISLVVYALLILGVKVVSKEYYFTLLICTKNLAKMRIQSEKIVLDAIKQYKSEISEDEKESFYQFIGLYEGEFKKLTEEKENS